MQSVLSPDVETFSTPPTTPLVQETDIRPSLSRRSSRPSSLRLAQGAGEWRPHVIVEESTGSPSPDLPPSAGAAANGRASGVKNPTPLTAIQSAFSTASGYSADIASAASSRSFAHLMNGAQSANGSGGDPAHPSSSPSGLAPNPSASQQQLSSSNPANTNPRTPRSQAMSSPCFVHSRLQDPSFSKWLEHNQISTQEDSRIGRIGKSYPTYSGSVTPNGGSSASGEGYEFWHDEEGSVSNVTKQLAETAVGVREMSKQLGESSRVVHFVAGTHTTICKVALESVLLSSRC